MATIDYGVLRAELLEDEAARGYAPLVAAGQDAAVADLLNEPVPGSFDTAPAYDRVTREAAFGCVALADWRALDAERKEALRVLLSCDSFDPADAQVREWVGFIFPPETATYQNLRQLVRRGSSRMEQLFGTGARATAADVSRALRG